MVNNLKSYWLRLTHDERETLATACGTTLGSLRNVVYGKRCGEKLAIDLERETRGIVRCEDLRPDVDWAYLRGTAAVNPENPQIPETREAA